jgi:hypothetical protein
MLFGRARGFRTETDLCAVLQSQWLQSGDRFVCCAAEPEASEQRQICVLCCRARGFGTETDLCAVLQSQRLQSGDRFVCCAAEPEASERRQICVLCCRARGFRAETDLCAVLQMSGDGECELPVLASSVVRIAK